MKNTYKYKQLILGIAIGAIATISISAIADYTYNVSPNPYPVKVNGNEQAIEGYNINDNTYFKLRDIGDKVGFGVDFENDTILVNVAGSMPKPTKEPLITATPIPWSEVPPQATELNPVFSVNISHENGLTSDGIPIKIDENGNKYVSTLDIDEVYHYEDKGYHISWTLEDRSLLGIYDEKWEAYVTDIPVAAKYDPTYEAYETMVRPFLIEHCGK